MNGWNTLPITAAILCGLNMTDLELQQYGMQVWGKFNKLFPRLAAFNAPSIKFNNRFSSTAGMCYYETSEIQISRKLFEIDRAEILNQTVPHEYAHQVSWNLYKAPGHCDTWKGIMRAYGLEPARCHTIGVTEIPDNTFELLAKRDTLRYGVEVSFEHRDRSRKITVHKGIVQKVNLKTIKVNVNGSIWTVPIESSSLKVV